MKALTYSISYITAFFVGILPFITSYKLFYGAVNAKYFFTMFSLSIFFMCIAYLLFFSKKIINIKWGRFGFLLSVFLFIYFIASFFGINFEKSLWSDTLRSTGVFFLTYIVLFAFLLGNFLEEKDWGLIRKTIAISAGFFSILSLLGVEGFGLEGRFLWIDLDIPGLTFGNSTFTGAYLLLAFIFGLIEICKNAKGSLTRKIMWGSVVIIALSPILSNIIFQFNLSFFVNIISNPIDFLGTARSSSATLFLMILFLIGRFLIIKNIFSVSIKYISPLWNILWIIGIFSGIGLLFTNDSFVQNQYIKASTPARIIVWQIGVDAIKEKPLLGWGPENFDQAFQKHFDNRLFLKENLGEIWFDRAHNIFVDLLVEVGFFGTIFIVVLIGYFFYILYRAKKSGRIEEIEKILLIVFVLAHILQLQTSFDTVGTYVLLGFFVAYGVWLEKNISQVSNISQNTFSQVYAAKILACFLVVISFVGLKYFVFDEYIRQKALVKTFTSENTKEQMDYVRRSLSRLSSFESLRLSSSSFIKGSLQQVVEQGGMVKNNEVLLSFMALYVNQYLTYLEKNPEDYRARMNYVYLLLVETSFGKNKLEEAKSILRDSYVLSPQNPLTFILDSLTDVYGGRFSLAKENIDKGIALNPSIVVSQNILTYIEKQEKQFPVVSLLKLENL